MTINYITGDLFSTPDKVIAHGCNAQGVMGSGVALQVKIEYPDVFEKYKEECHFIRLSSRNGLPPWTNIIVPAKDKIIVNMITQEYFGKENKRYVSYDAIDICFDYLFHYCWDNEIDSISIPKIGAGLGGGNWDTIISIIEDRMKTVNVNVYVLPEQIIHEGINI